MNRQSGGILSAGTRRKQLRPTLKSAIVLAALLLLAACGRQATENATIVDFSAAGHDVHDHWRLNWEVTGTENVFLNGEPVYAHASTTVEVTEPVTYTLRAGSESREIYLEPYPELRINSLSADFDAATARAGAEAEIAWTVTGAEQLELVEVVTGDTDRTVTTLDPALASVNVNLPADKAEVNYRLIAANPFGERTEGMLFDAPVSLPGWICLDPDDVITIEDPELLTAVWGIYEGTALEPEDGVLTCGIVQDEFFSPRPLESDEYGMLEQHNAIILNRCDQDEDPLVTTLEGIQHLSTLLRLELMCNEIGDVSQLAGLTSLQELNLDRNLVSDLAPLTGLTDLRVLGLYQNEVEDVTPLAGLTELQILYLSENFIRDVTPLAGLVNLEHLWLYMNCRDLNGERPTDCLQDLTGLSGLHNLVSLVIHVNEIEDMSVLNSDMTRLELVDANHNLLTDIAPLALPPTLSTVRLDTNLVSDIGPLAANTGLPSTEEPFYWERVDPGTEQYPAIIVSMPINQGSYPGHISLHQNCLDEASTELAGHLQALEDRGADVQGVDVAQQSQPGCAASALSSLGLSPQPFNPEGLLREDSRWYRNR